MTDKKHPPTPSTLNEAIYHQVHHSSKPAKVIAEALNIASSTLYSAANESVEGARFPVQWLPTIINTTGDYTALDMLERLTGRVAVRLDAKFKDGITLQDEVLRVAKEFGNVCEVIGKSLGRKTQCAVALTEEEKCHIRKKTYDLLQEAARLWKMAEGL
jgi:hypothetical protein